MRIMDLLTENQILSCKEFGKAKVYMINQDLFPETSQDQLTMLDEQIQVRKEEHDGLQVKLKACTAKVKEITDTGATNAAIQAKLDASKKTVAELEEKLAPFLASGAKLVTEAEL